jgi:tetratricopeptide (TPR) repeat protein
MLIGFFVIAGLGALGVRAIVRQQQFSKLPPIAREDPEQRKRDAAGAFVGGAVSPDLDLGEVKARAGIRATLDRVVAAAKASNGIGVVNQIDVDRMVAELDRQDVLPGISEREKKELPKALKLGLQQSAVIPGNYDWDHYQIRRVKLLGEGEAIAYIGGLDSRGVAVKRRLWLRLERAPSNGGWKLYDMEDLDTGIRFTTAIGVAVGSGQGFGGGVPVSQAMRIIRDATADILGGKPDAAEAKLATIAGTPLPPMIDALRNFAKANACNAAERYDEALTFVAKARALHPDLAAVDLSEAIALNGLGRHAEALTVITRYLDLLGDDGVSRSTCGDALLGLGRNEEARRSYLLGLDADPGSPDCLHGLAVAATAGATPGEVDQKTIDEITARIRTAGPSAAQIFFASANYSLKRREVAPLSILVRAYQPIAGGDFWATYFDAEVAVLRKDFAAAIEPLRIAWQAAPAQHRPTVLVELLGCYQLSGQHLRGYKELSQSVMGADVAFRRLGRSLIPSGDNVDKNLPQCKTLLDLVELHRARAPKDPWVYYLEGEARYSLNQYEQAMAAFTTAVRLAPRPASGAQASAPEAPQGTDDTDVPTDERDPAQALLLFQQSRAAAAFSAGKSLQAYDQDVFPHETFTSLARLHANALDADGLAAVIERHRSIFPQDPTLALWDVEAAFRRGDYVKALDRMTEARNRIPPDSLDRWRVEDRAVRSLLKQGRADEAKAFIGSDPPDPWYSAMIFASSGKASEAIALMDQMIAHGERTADNFYADPGFAEAIASPAFAEWRKKHPAVKPSNPKPQ